MARRRKGRPIDGVLLVDKPAGITSNGALQRAKRAFFAAKAGHTGSLDPLATGVLPLCFGEATKFSQFLLDANKEYVTTIVLGVTTNTGDADGEIIEERSAAAVDEQAVAALLPDFVGDVVQTPSMFSAIKHQGKPLYELARQGIEVERKQRTIHIFELELLAFRPGEKAELELRVKCSKGTYIRSLAEDIGHALGCGGHVAKLHRTGSGPFEIAACVSLEKVEALAEEKDFATLNGLLLPVDSGLQDLPQVELPEDSGYYLRQGQPVLVPNSPSEGVVRVALESGEFLGVGEVMDDGRLAPRRLVVTNAPKESPRL